MRPPETPAEQMLLTIGKDGNGQICRLPLVLAGCILLFGGSPIERKLWLSNCRAELSGYADEINGIILRVPWLQKDRITILCRKEKESGQEYFHRVWRLSQRRDCFSCRRLIFIWEHNVPPDDAFWTWKIHAMSMCRIYTVAAFPASAIEQIRKNPASVAKKAKIHFHSGCTGTLFCGHPFTPEPEVELEQKNIFS